MLLYYDEFSKRRVKGHLLKLTYLVGRSSINFTGEQSIGVLFISVNFFPTSCLLCCKNKLIKKK